MLYSFVFHCDFSNPNRITNKANRTTIGCAFFCDTATRRKLAFVSEGEAKKRHLRQQNADLLHHR